MPAQPESSAEVPQDGLLPWEVATRIIQKPGRTFSLYIHIPFCAVRCGYCDFNTYVSKDLGPGASHESFADTTIAELEFAHKVIQNSGIPQRKLQSVFFGGGTPTLLPAADLVRILQHAIGLWGIQPGAEITTEANPDTLSLASLRELRDGGFTRLSMGMQSAVPHVLKVLDRTHDQANVDAAVAWAKQLGLEVSLDLIYGAPGESLSDWETSLDAVIALEPDHISAYGLIIEDGTKLAAQIRRGEYPEVDPDIQADMYLLADEKLQAAGYRWYEVSNWAYDPQETGMNRAEHNLAYWRNMDWWGIGPGSHSHFAGVRFWNAKHPAAFAQRLAQGVSPAVGREIPDTQARLLENIMLGVRLSDGLDVSVLEGHDAETFAEVQQHLRDLEEDGLIQSEPLKQGRIVPTLRGRLLDDAITRALAGF